MCSIALRCNVMSPHVCHWNILSLQGNIGPSTFMVTFVSILPQQQNKSCWPEKIRSRCMTNRGRYITTGSVTRPGIDQSCEETLACCNFRCVHTNDISGSESRSFPTHLCHADASHTSLTSARFQMRNTRASWLGFCICKRETGRSRTLWSGPRVQVVFLSPLVCFFSDTFCTDTFHPSARWSPSISATTLSMLITSCFFTSCATMTRIFGIMSRRRVDQKIQPVSASIAAFDAWCCHKLSSTFSASY